MTSVINSIALVDDDPSVRCALQRLLVTMGFGVSVFCSAEEFLSQDDSNKFACLLLDIHLDGMSGLDLSLHLSMTGSKLPIIFMSAAPDAACALRATSGGDRLLLTKPLDADLLDAALSKTLMSVTIPEAEEAICPFPQPAPTSAPTKRRAALERGSRPTQLTLRLAD